MNLHSEGQLEGLEGHSSPSSCPSSSAPGDQKEEEIGSRSVQECPGHSSASRTSATVTPRMALLSPWSPDVSCSSGSELKGPGRRSSREDGACCMARSQKSLVRLHLRPESQRVSDLPTCSAKCWNSVAAMPLLPWSWQPSCVKANSKQRRCRRGPYACSLQHARGGRGEVSGGD
jgi:hypothetical protein